MNDEYGSYYITAKFTSEELDDLQVIIKGIGCTKLILQGRKLVWFSVRFSEHP